MRKLQKPGKMFARTVLAFTCVLVAAVLFLSIVLYKNFERTGFRLMTETNMNMLSQISYSADYMNDNARNFAYSLFNDSAVTSLMYQDDKDFSRLFLDMNRFRQLVEANTFVQSLTIYNQRLNTIWTIPENASHKIDDEVRELLNQAASREDGLKPVPRKIRSNTVSPLDTPQYTDVYTYVVYDLLSSDGGVEGAVVVDIKGEYLKSIIDSLNAKYASTQGETLIIDRQGTVVLNAGQQIVNEESKLSFMPKVLEAGGGTGYFTGTIDNRPVMVTYVSSELLGWKFIKVIPYDLITKDIDKIRQVTIIVCLIFLLSGLAVAFVLSRWIYSPLRNLVGEVKKKTISDEGPRLSGTDEVSLLSDAFTHTYEQARQHGLAARDILAIRKNEMLCTLLAADEPSIDYIHRSIGKFKLSLEAEEVALPVVLKIDRYGDFVSDYSARDRLLLRYAWVNAAREWLFLHYKGEVVDTADDFIVLILQKRGDYAGDLIRHASDTISDLQEWSAEHLKLGFSAAFGYAGKTCAHLSEAYDEARNVMKYRFIFGHGAVIIPDMLAVRHTEHFKLSPEREHEWFEALASGQLEQARKIYDDIVAELQTYSYDTMMSTFLYITYFIYNTVLTIENNSLHKFNLNFNTFTREIGELETLAEVNRTFSELFAKITGVLKERRNKRSAVLTEKIAALIESNYMDKTLCLESIAHTFNLTKVYIGKLFRDDYGQSVADYITEIRLKRVMALLDADHTRPLDSILDEIGFENKNYFYKLFKSRVGVSYNDYKLKNFKERDIRL